MLTHKSNEQSASNIFMTLHKDVAVILYSNFDEELACKVTKLQDYFAALQCWPGISDIHLTWTSYMAQEFSVINCFHIRLCCDLQGAFRAMMGNERSCGCCCTRKLYWQVLWACLQCLRCCSYLPFVVGINQTFWFFVMTTEMTQQAAVVCPFAACTSTFLLYTSFCTVYAFCKILYIMTCE